MILVGLGANLPGRAGAPPAATVEAAIAALGRLPGLALAARSRLWGSAAWPDPSGPRYVNAVALLRGQGVEGGDPGALLARLHAIEAAEGRVRGVANAPRPLDLDLLAVDNLVIDRPGLVLPHPRMQDRAFVLGPLAEIMPHWRHPVLGRTAAELLAALPPADAAPLGPDGLRRPAGAPM